MWVKKDINVKIGISQYVALNTFLLLVRIHKFSSGLSPKRAYFRECLFLGFLFSGKVYFCTPYFRTLRTTICPSE